MDFLKGSQFRIQHPWASCANLRNWTKRHRCQKIQYYKVHFQYYKLLRSTTKSSPILQSTTKYYFVLQKTTQYCKVLLRYYSVLQSTQPSATTAPATKSDTWPSPSTAPTTKSDTWPSPSTAPTTKSDTSPSPSIAPATQNDSQAWSSSHMKRHFQCAEKQMSPSKLTKYCACHAKWPCNIWQKFAKNSWNVISNARPIREWSDHDPITFRDRLRQSATRHATEVPFRAPDERFVLKNTTFRAPAIFPNFTKYDTWTSPSTAPTTQSDTWTSPSTAPTTKSDTWPSPSTAPTTKSDTWPSPSTAPTTKSDTWPSPSTAPATQNDSQAWSSSHMKRHVQCAEKQMSPSKLTKYCACHAK